MRDEGEIQVPKSAIYHRQSPISYFSLLTPHPPSAHLILLIGLPGSGKSTMASKLMQECPQRKLISTDRIRSQLFGDESVQGSWLKVWQEVGNQFRQTMQQILAGEVSEAIFDATNVVRKQRREAIALARTVGFTSITGLWLHPPLWVCLERNERRDRQVPTSVILDMYRSLIGAPPSLQEGLDKLVEVKGKAQ
jgi:predicted kinase